MILLGKSLTAILGGSGGGSSTFVGLSDKVTADIPAINTPLATALNARELSSNKKTDVDANKTSDVFFPTVRAVFDWVSGLFMMGAASSTDNAIARFDGTTGKLVQNSGVTITDAGNVGIGTMTPTAKLEVAATELTGYIRLTPALNYLVTISDGGLNTYYGNNPSVAKLLNIQLNGGVTSFGGDVGIGTASPTAKLDVNGTFRSRGNATFNGQIIDNTGSLGTDDQVLKKVGGLVKWSNP